jgi:Holliday junction DNA helicase RuvA
MFAYITGSVENISYLSAGGAAVTVGVNDVGFLLMTSTETVSKVRLKDVLRFYTHFKAGDDGVTLFGFSSVEEKDMFLLLTSVTGIGPKAALGLLSAMSPSKIALAVVTDDFNALSKAPGVGRKTAQRLAMELKDRIKGFDAVADQAVSAQQLLPQDAPVGDAKREAVEALVALGYPRSESVKAVLEIAAPGLEAEQIIKAAFRKLAVF